MAEIKRLNYFNSQFLVDKDFKDEQAYHISMRRRHNQLLHTWGVADGGFQVTKTSDKSVTVGSGMAIDKDGQEIVLLGPQLVDLSAFTANADVYLTVGYKEVQDPTDHYTVGGLDNYNRTTERPNLQAATSVPTSDGSVILLARIHLDASSNIATVDNSVRQLASSVIAPESDLAVSSLALTDPTVPANQWPSLRLGAPKRADLSGSLNVSGDVNITGKLGIGTAGPSEKLHLEAGSLFVNGEGTGVIVDAGGLKRLGFMKYAGREGGIWRLNNQDFEIGRVNAEVTALPGSPTGFTTDLYVAGNGNVGIGTTDIPGNSRLAVVGGAITINSSPQRADAAIHITSSFGGFDRLLQMSPTGPSKPGLNLLASHDAAGNEQWWAWGVTTDYKWRIQPGTVFGGSGGLTIDSTGNVGIGTTQPGFKLDVADRMRVRQGASGTAGIWYFQTTPNADRAFIGMATDNLVGLWGNTGAGWGLVMDTTNGNVGLGTLNPAQKLHVNGAITTTQAHTIKIGVPSPATPPRYGNDGIRGEPNLWLDAAGTVFIKPGFQTPTGFDIAERFKTIEQIEPGHVVVFDDKEAAVKLCDKEGDNCVVGIASTEPAFILGGNEQQIPIALCGRVFCKVDADISPIAVGDLLTTSPTKGHAQKALDLNKSSGAIMGKALGKLEKGKGEILVLVLLQ